MKKIFILFVISAFILANVTACSGKRKAAKNMIQSKRRFAEYVEPQTKKTGVVDLSEGIKLDYDKKLGPQNLNFDIKIVDPY